MCFLDETPTSVDSSMKGREDHERKGTGTPVTPSKQQIILHRLHHLQRFGEGAAGVFLGEVPLRASDDMVAPQ